MQTFKTESLPLPLFLSCQPGIKTQCGCWQLLGLRSSPRQSAYCHAQGFGLDPQQCQNKFVFLEAPILRLSCHEVNILCCVIDVKFRGVRLYNNLCFYITHRPNNVYKRNIQETLFSLFEPLEWTVPEQMLSSHSPVNRAGSPCSDIHFCPQDYTHRQVVLSAST